MTVSRIKLCAAASSLVLAACSGSPGAPASPPASPTSLPSGSAESLPAGLPSGSSPSQPADPPEASPTPPKPNPAASTSGPLSGDTMPKRLLEFKPVPGKASEGEYQPNGTFVHALDPKLSVRDALPQCGKAVQVPGAKHALGASYEDDKGRLGNGIAFQFASEAEASKWFTSFTGLIKQCQVESMKPVITKTTLQDQRLSGEGIWTEAGLVRGDRVTLVIIEGIDHDPKKLLNDLTG